MESGAAAGASLLVRIAVQAVWEQEEGKVWRSGVLLPCARTSPEAGVPEQDIGALRNSMFFRDAFHLGGSWL